MDQDPQRQARQSETQPNSQPEPTPTPDLDSSRAPATPFVKVLAIAAAVLLLVVCAGYIYLQIPKPFTENTEQDLTPEIDTSNLQTYQNEEYGFQMELSYQWYDNMYVVKTNPHSYGVNIQFQLPTVTDGSYETVCFISVSSKEEWAAWQQEEIGKPVYLTEDTEQVYGYGCGHEDWEVYEGFEDYTLTAAQQDPDLHGPIRAFEKSVTETFTVPGMTVDTSNWQIYRNERRGFEFRYPPDWIIFESEYPIAGFTIEITKSDELDGLTSNINLNIDEESIESYREKLSLVTELQSIEQQQINGIAWEISVLEDTGEIHWGRTISALTERGDETYQLVSFESEKEVHNQILETIQFFEPDENA